MKTRIRAIILAVAMLIIGTTVGYIAGSKSGDAQLKASVQQLSLAQAAKETALYTRMLEGLREGKQDLVADRLEIMLDYSVIHVGFQYAPEYDLDGWVGKSLTLARDYRALHPHRPSADWAAKRLDAALSLKSGRK